jgi:hypothetical protein
MIVEGAGFIGARYRLASIISSYLLITILITWPLILHLDGFLLVKGYGDVYHSDTYGFIGHMVKAGELLYNNDSLFNFNHPPDDFAITFDYFGVLLISMGFSPIIAYNLFFLSSLFLSGLFMYLLMFELSKDGLSSFFSGFVYMSSNYVFNEYVWGHPNLWQIQWIPLIFLLIEGSLDVRGIRYPVALGVVLALQVYSSTQYAVYLSFIVPVYILLRIYFVDKNILSNKSVWLNVSLSVIVAFFWIVFAQLPALSLALKM